MDFETIFPALPKFAGMWPYAHLPFQWSVHRQEQLGTSIKRHDFLAESTSDPRLPFLESLCQVVKGAGSIAVYNKIYEASRPFLLLNSTLNRPRARKSLQRLRKKARHSGLLFCRYRLILIYVGANRNSRLVPFYETRECVQLTGTNTVHEASPSTNMWEGFTINQGMRRGGTLE